MSSDLFSFALYLSSIRLFLSEYITKFRLFSESYFSFVPRNIKMKIRSLIIYIFMEKGLFCHDVLSQDSTANVQQNNMLAVKVLLTS